MLTFYKKNKYFIDNVQKFVEVKNNKFESSDCADQIYKKWDSDWDIFLLFVDGREDPKIYKKWQKRRPLYAVFGKNYVLVTKIISKQIFCMAAKCGVREIMDLYLYEMGAVLLDDPITPLRQFYGISYPDVIWDVDPKICDHITPKMHGWFSKNTELCLLWALKNIPHRNIVELGSWLGKSTKFIIENMQEDATLYCFDKFQNIALTPYDFSKKSPIDQFYFTTPRYETFCANIAPSIGKKKVKTIKFDVNEFLAICRRKFIKPDIVFIDAIKSKSKLFRILQDIFRFNPNICVIGDDYVFSSVKEAVADFVKIQKCNCFTTNDAYILMNRPLDISKFIKNNYFKNATDYDKMYYYLYNDHEKAAKCVKNLDINKPIKNQNENTIYHLITIIEKYQKTPLPSVRNALSQKPRPVKNVLGLTYLDYEKYEDLLY